MKMDMRCYNRGKGCHNKYIQKVSSWSSWDRKSYKLDMGCHKLVVGCYNVEKRFSPEVVGTEDVKLLDTRCRKFALVYHM